MNAGEPTKPSNPEQDRTFDIITMANYRAIKAYQVYFDVSSQPKDNKPYLP